MTEGGPVTGRVDRVEEWEYVRAVLSLGLWGSIVITGILFFAAIKKKKAGSDV